MASYLRAAAKRDKVDESLEDWVSNRFGRRLYELFFKSYTEKVWGVPTREIRAEWAAQRIKGLSFFSAAKAAFFGNKGNKVKSLISEFNYPRFGPGQMWDAMTDGDRGRRAARCGSTTPVDRLEIAGGRVVEVEAGGESYTLPEAVISSLPLRERRRDGRARARRRRCSTPRAGSATATSSRSRSSSTARISSPTTGSTSTSRTCASAASRTSARGRRGWSRTPTRRASGSSTSASRATISGRWPTTTSSRSPRASSSSSASRRARRSSAASRSACRRRTRSTTPTTPSASRRSARWLDGIENLQQVGRNGLHRYNNSDHSMLTAMRAVDNLLAGAHHDIWEVNAESVYHETARRGRASVPLGARDARDAGARRVAP